MTKKEFKQALKNYPSLSAELQELKDILPQLSQPEQKTLLPQIKKLEEEIADISREINKIGDSRVRRIIRYRYLQHPPLSWKEVATKMGYNNLNAPWRVLDRYLNKAEREGSA